MHPHRWLGQFSGWSHLELQLRLLQQVPARDWVLLARADEFVQLPGGTLAAVVDAAAGEGATWVGGVVRDRVGADGQRAAVGTSLTKQFALRCSLTATENDDAPLLHVVMFQVCVREVLPASSRIITCLRHLFD